VVVFNQQAFIVLAVLIIALFALFINMFAKTSKKGETAQRRCSFFSYFNKEQNDLGLNFSASSEADGDQSFFQSISGI
jgi:hypothetical protein